ncbi:MAG: GNAT family N-acetyltransferase [Candidatus Muirbacterium halophilum]|nr:GNAT family N-acetyltransferase [Candidatus Muirbacterium halophilum]MCK9475377.1 GNAT family N-acetyltransferase [Candidatus Muirbacterium halophilum]
MRKKIKNKVKIEVEIVNRPDTDILNKIINIEKESFGIGAIHEWVLAPFILSSKVIVLKVNNEISGVSIFIKEFEEDCVFYFTLALLKKHRGKGLGKYFFESSVNIIFEKFPKINKIRYTVDPENNFNNEFFKNYGAKQTDFFKSIYGEGVDRNYVVLTRNDFYENITF